MKRTLLALGACALVACWTGAQAQDWPARQVRLIVPTGPGAATDVSHAFQLITVAGPHARALLARGTPLDLHATRFPAGACAQTRFARAHVLIHAVDAAPTFHVQVRRSLARYLWDYLAAVAPHAMAEQDASG